MFDLCKHLGRDKKHLFQKVLDINKANPAKLKFPMWASEKFDGVFCAAIMLPDGNIGIFSRTGEQYTSMKHIEEDIKNVFGKFLKVNYDNIILFEAYCFNVPQSIISGWCRDTKEQHTEIKAMTHGYISGNLTIPCNIKDVGAIIRIPHQTICSLQEAYAFAESVWGRGGEGIVLKSMDSQYHPGKRNESIVKIKKILSYDLEVVNICEGKGKYVGTVGSLICQWKEGKTLKVSGMTDEQRKEWWNNPSKIIGKIIEVHAMTESSKGLLREPRFKEIRYDKLEADV